MTAFDGLQLDPDGFVDMDQLPDDDLSDAELAQLRDTLHADPVEEPTAEEWDAMFDEALAGRDDGPFALEDVDGLVGEDDLAEPSPEDVADADVDTDTDTDAAADADAAADTDIEADADVDTDVPGTEGSDLFDLDGTDLDGGLDLAPDDTVDDAFSADALDDAPADIAGNDFEDLL